MFAPWTCEERNTGARGISRYRRGTRQRRGGRVRRADGGWIRQRMTARRFAPSVRQRGASNVRAPAVRQCRAEDGHRQVSSAPARNSGTASLSTVIGGGSRSASGASSPGHDATKRSGMDGARDRANFATGQASASGGSRSTTRASTCSHVRRLIAPRQSVASKTSKPRSWSAWAIFWAATTSSPTSSTRRPVRTAATLAVAASRVPPGREALAAADTWAGRSPAAPFLPRSAGIRARTSARRAERSASARRWASRAWERIARVVSFLRPRRRLGLGALRVGYDTDETSRDALDARGGAARRRRQM